MSSCCVWKHITIDENLVKLYVGYAMTSIRGRLLGVDWPHQHELSTFHGQCQYRRSWQSGPKDRHWQDSGVNRRYLQRPHLTRSALYLNISEALRGCVMITVLAWLNWTRSKSQVAADEQIPLVGVRSSQPYNVEIVL